MNRLKQIREGIGAKQSEIADMLSVSQGTLSNWERGVHDPDSESLNMLADHYCVSIDYILCRTDDPTPPNKKEGDDDIWDLREQLRRQPNMRLLFSASKNATEEDLLKVVKIVELLKSQNEPDVE